MNAKETSEIFKHLEEGGRVRINGHIYTEKDKQRVCRIWSNTISNSPSEAYLLPKKVKLFRYTYKTGDKTVQSKWTTQLWVDVPSNEILKTEQKDVCFD